MKSRNSPKPGIESSSASGEPWALISRSAERMAAVALRSRLSGKMTSAVAQLAQELV